MAPRVFIESPFRGNNPVERERNARYLRRVLRDSIERGEAPYASHAIYPRVLDDDDPNQRAAALALGEEYRKISRTVAFYVDHGMSPGMLDGLERSIGLAEDECGLDTVSIDIRRLGNADLDLED